MQRSTLTSRFLSGFQPSQMPPRGPDGLIPAGPPSKLPVIDPPTLCEAGPCRHYHRVVSEMDVQQALDGTDAPVREQITRACYPSPGIELELGETPVFQCSRWEPDMSEESRLNEQRKAFMKTPLGKQFAEDVAAFEAANAASKESYDAPIANPDGSITHAKAPQGAEVDIDDIDELVGGEA